MRRCHTASGKASTEQYYGHTQLMWIISLSCWCTVLTTFQHTCSSQRAQLSISNGKKEIAETECIILLDFAENYHYVVQSMKSSVPCGPVYHASGDIFQEGWRVSSHLFATTSQISPSMQHMNFLQKATEISL